MTASHDIELMKEWLTDAGEMSSRPGSGTAFLMSRRGSHVRWRGP
ncbi:hypothetical protein ACSDR0_36355 [Streptosporangium sp. G11]